MRSMYFGPAVRCAAQVGGPCVELLLSADSSVRKPTKYLNNALKVNNSKTRPSLISHSPKDFEDI